MAKILVISGDTRTATKLRAELGIAGFTSSIIPDGEEAIKQIAERPPDLVLIDFESHIKIRELAEMIKRERDLPVIALILSEILDRVENLDRIDDFSIKPYEIRELVLRIKRLLGKTQPEHSNELIECGDLLIDLVKYEVTLSGRPIMLTFMEYELLKFLASNKGRVFTRDALLNKVWGYDYYGGDRTVDVHIRRLRSKIEDPTHTFIETVRNIGYRFKEES
ncbi:MAG: response regulator transcription factor [Chloroflexota bacterium]